MINSVSEFTDRVLTGYERWKNEPQYSDIDWVPWFRGECVAARPLLPKLYRCKPPYPENELLQNFRRMAALPNQGVALDRKLTDAWLYLARHTGLPTRLLDWSEGALIGLYFAVHKKRPGVVWMLQPVVLNELSCLRGFDLPWHPPHPSAGNLRAAWQEDKDPNQRDYPVAIYPTYVHPRLQVQRACFTVHGKQKGSLLDLMKKARRSRYLKEYRINPKRHDRIIRELRLLGISHSSLFPDLDGLAEDLTMRYWRGDDH